MFPERYEGLDLVPDAPLVSDLDEKFAVRGDVVSTPPQYVFVTLFQIGLDFFDDVSLVLDVLLVDKPNRQVRVVSASGIEVPTSWSGTIRSKTIRVSLNC